MSIAELMTAGPWAYSCGAVWPGAALDTEGMPKPGHVAIAQRGIQSNPTLLGRPGYESDANLSACALVPYLIRLARQVRAVLHPGAVGLIATEHGQEAGDRVITTAYTARHILSVIDGTPYAQTEEYAQAIARQRVRDAAPDLLAALQAAIPALIRLGDFVGNIDDGGPSGQGRIDRCALIANARAAIAKATGEGS